MKKSFVILLHVGFWLCYFTLVVIVLAVYHRSRPNITNQEGRVMNAFYNIMLFAFIPSVISYFTYYFFLFPRYLQQKKYLLSVILAVQISLLAAIAGYVLLRFFIESGYVLDMDEGGRNGRSTAFRVILVMTTIGIICGIVALVIKGFITWFNEIRLKEALREKNHEMEMALVKLQLDPHLLFNTINNIDALIVKDAGVASEYLNKLSDIMRFILYETRTERIALSRELEYIEKYVALQQIRTANEHYVSLSVKGDPVNKKIAPMIIIPFIENAFKHSTNKKTENAIVVQLEITEKTVELFCENKFDAKSKSNNSIGGLGNELIEKRLSLIYPGKHSLDVQRTDDLYSIHLTIPHE